MKQIFNYKYAFLLGLGILQSVICEAQIKTIKFEQNDSLQSIKNKPLVIFIHTDWCQYCQSMENTTFKNKEIIKLLNEKFYFISLNAEEEKNIWFNQRNFNYQPTGYKTGINELAKELATHNGQLSYPAICFLNSKNEIIYQHHGFLSAPQFLKLLHAISGS
ncbi:thioredoxin family protein [Pedobacter cryophilus]|uniref:Thioredoxin family protein n=1 Tax=Pedobacter cryophilus TaxID=2571271 RepID=A0A4U1C1Z9_9SPHI|nr:thioredoxin family protein [Pedobacter cryophilus]TKB99027.1 thioredoxin family protein [Pedobacter cryophilus]